MTTGQQQLLQIATSMSWTKPLAGTLGNNHLGLPSICWSRVVSGLHWAACFFTSFQSSALGMHSAPGWLCHMLLPREHLQVQARPSCLQGHLQAQGRMGRGWVVYGLLLSWEL